MTPSFQVVNVAAVAGTAVALAGLPKVAIAILTASSALFLPIYLLTNRIGATEVELVPTGFRAYMGRASVLVRWDNVSAFEQWGAPEHRRILFVKVRDKDQISRSVEPDVPDARARLGSFALMDPGLMLRPWIGGISSLALERTFRAAMVFRPTSTDSDGMN